MRRAIKLSRRKLSRSEFRAPNDPGSALRPDQHEADYASIALYCASHDPPFPWSCKSIFIAAPLLVP
jgi:hypothetical protein